MKLYKYVLLLASGGSLLALGSCGRWAIDFLYILPQISDSLSSLTGG